MIRIRPVTGSSADRRMSLSNAYEGWPRFCPLPLRGPALELRVPSKVVKSHYGVHKTNHRYTIIIIIINGCAKVLMHCRCQSAIGVRT